MFHRFNSDIKNISLPERFTYPFNYTPHPLCVKAAEEVQRYVGEQTAWQQELSKGKMFGVLVVQNERKEIGYLAAFSGVLAKSNKHEFFVPPIYDVLNPNGYFKAEEKNISEISRQINECMNEETVAQLKEERRARSEALQMWLFRQFVVHNALGETKDLCQVFERTIRHRPPGGAGECAEPKLLQYAYLNGYKPLAMAAFWWGASPKNEVREHGRYYPACRGRCEHILQFMLQGIDVEDNPLKERMKLPTGFFDIIYEDEFLAVINKPYNMLTIPGNIDEPSVFDIIRDNARDIEGPLIVHRLDYATSGLLVVTKNRTVNSHIQVQFQTRKVEKRYSAILDGIVEKDKGIIELPIRAEVKDRPRQIVDYEHGRRAVTGYEVQSRRDGKTYIKFYPHTGRTHQLRVHASHPDGLNCPIVGDTLYGTESDRLYLHADYIRFEHPVTGETMEFSLPAPWSDYLLSS